MNEQLFTRQFLLTKHSTTELGNWNQSAIGEFTLFTHPKLETCQYSKNKVELLLIGYFFDYEKPKATNRDILKKLANNTFEAYLRHLDRYTGQFVLLRKDESSTTLISDAGAQREVYYSNDFSTFASQPKLLSAVLHPKNQDDPLTIGFYQSGKFDKKRLHIMDNTQWADIKHLQPNHYLDLTTQKRVRFFPYAPRKENPLGFVVDESIKRITGYFEAVASRYKVALPVTAGYDSRLLFAASLKTNCRRFIFKHRKLNDKHYDVAVPQKLLKLHNLGFEVITYDEVADKASKQLHHNSIDFARDFNTAMIYNGYQPLFHNYMVVDTIMSELARNKYGNFKQLNAKDLAYLNGYKNNKFVITEYQNWLDRSSETILQNKYHIPDLFYWEEIMGNWAAKYKTEYGLVIEFFSLLNSRELIDLMMSVNIKYRQPNNNILYNTIIERLSPQALSLPMNPSRRTSIQKLMQKLRVFDLYRYLRIKLKL